MGESCIFCEIVAGREPASVVHENAEVLAFMDLRQPNKGHCLIVPKQHIETIFELDAATGAALIDAVSLVARGVKAAFRPQGVTITQQNGAPWQEVMHVHFHVYARHRGDGILRVYDGMPATTGRSELDRQAALIREALAGVS